MAPSILIAPLISTQETKKARNIIVWTIPITKTGRQEEALIVIVLKSDRIVY